MDGNASEGQWEGADSMRVGGRDWRLHSHPSPRRMRGDAVGLAFAQLIARRSSSRSAASVQFSSYEASR
jgi:hypothetical protein